MYQSEGKATLDCPESNLSSREVQVLRMASRGLTNAEIARELGVSVHTVKFHLASVYKKLGVANRTEAAVSYLAGKTESDGGSTP